MSESQTCACATAARLLFACSGAADVGELADRSARRMSKQGLGRMYCLAGIGGMLPDFIANTQAAEKILAIDGCKSDCARQTLERAGLRNYIHLRLSDMGFEKGESPASGENIDKVVQRANQLLA